MKILLVMLLLTESVLAWEKIELNQKEFCFDDVSTCPVAWFLAKWVHAGYDIPKNGVPFHWGDYVRPLDPKTDTPQKWDVVKYVDDKGVDKGAIVFDVMKDGIIAEVPVDVELGVVIYRPMKFKDCVGFLRPLHKGVGI